MLGSLSCPTSKRSVIPRAGLRSPVVTDDISVRFNPEAPGSEIWSIQISRANCNVTTPSSISLILEQPGSTYLSYLDSKCARGLGQANPSSDQFSDIISRQFMPDRAPIPVTDRHTVVLVYHKICVSFRTMTSFHIVEPVSDSMR